jgi:hypothetical protein
VSILGPVVLCGVLTAVPSAIPLLGLLNFFVPGFWFWVGGILVAAIVVRRGARPDTTYGAVVGFLAATLGAVLLVFIDVFLTISGVAAVVAKWYYSFLPEATAEALRKIGVPLDPVAAASGLDIVKTAFMALLIWLLAAATFGTLGGAIGVRLGRRSGEKPQTEQAA